MCRMGKSLAEMTRELSEMKILGGGVGKPSLPALPAGSKGRALPGVSSWRAWTQSKLAGGPRIERSGGRAFQSRRGRTFEVRWQIIFRAHWERAFRARSGRTFRAR